MAEQSFMHLRRDSMFLWQGDKAVYVVGINYLPSYTTRIFWADFREDRIEQDMARIADLGLNAVRVPVHWPHVEPRLGEFNHEFFDCFDRFLDLLAKYDLCVMPFVLVGTCCGMFFPDYARGKSLFEPEMLEAEQAHLEALVSAFRDSDRILAWDLSDEPYHYQIPAKSDSEEANSFSSPDTVTPAQLKDWAESLNRTSKAAAPNHLTTMGLHFGMPSHDWGFHSEELVDAMDMFGPGGCAGPGGAQVRDDMPRGTLNAAFITHYHTSLGKPTFLSEAPMRSSTIMSNRIIARNYSSSLPTVMGVGGNGIMPWVMHDYEEQEHYEAPGIVVAPHEAEWGIFTADGQAKPQAEVLGDFAKLARSIDFSDLAPVRPDVQMLLSSQYVSELQHEARSFRGHYGAYVLAQLSGFTCGMSRETELLDGGPVPAVSITPSWSFTHPRTARLLLDKVEAGGGVLSSYGGAQNFITPLLPKLFGVEVMHMRDNPEPGAVRAGSVEINLPAGPQLFVEATDGEVIATVGDGSPAAVRCQHGEGSAVLLTFPIERAFNDRDLSIAQIKAHVAFYRHLLRQCGAVARTEVEADTVSVHSLASAAGDRELIILTNHVPEGTEVRVTLPASPASAKLLTDGELSVVDGGFEMSLGPNGYHVVEVLCGDLRDAG